MDCGGPGFAYSLDCFSFKVIILLCFGVPRRSSGKICKNSTPAIMIPEGNGSPQFFPARPSPDLLLTPEVVGALPPAVGSTLQRAD